MENCDCSIAGNCQENICLETIRQKSDAPTVILTFLFILITYIYSLFERI